MIKNLLKPGLNTMHLGAKLLPNISNIMNDQHYFWVIETPKSMADPSLHWHIVYRLTKPSEYISGPFSEEGKGIDWLNAHLNQQPPSHNRINLQCSPFA